MHSSMHSSMHKDERDLLEVLKAELAFVEKRGYGRSSRESWRRPLIFEDSPSCINYDSKYNAEPCSSCALFQLVPPEFRGKQIPCRHIPFNTQGETLDTLSRNLHQFEIEEVFRDWLRNTISALEKAPQQESRPSVPRGSEAAADQHLFQKLRPKCANPACPTEFRWLEGGKFFRFRPESVASQSSTEDVQPTLQISGVRHYWLCEHCSHVFTLTFDDSAGVMLKLSRPEAMAAEHQKHSTT